MLGKVVHVDDSQSLVIVAISRSEERRPKINQEIFMAPLARSEVGEPPEFTNAREESDACKEAHTDTQWLVDKLIAGVDDLERIAMVEHWHKTRPSMVRTYAQLRRQIHKNHQGDLSADHAGYEQEED